MSDHRLSGRISGSKAAVAGFAAALLAAATALSCRVDTEAFQRRLFACDTGANDPLCGTDRDGKPMTCFAARPLGGTFDFCVESCGDTPMSLPDEGAVCVQGGAKLTACDPTTDTPNAPSPGPCGNAQLGCLRTNVVPEPGQADEGVCVTEHPCLDNLDCKDPVKATCAATFLTELYAQAPAEKLHPDHLYCLQEGCISGSTSCSPGESCLPNLIPPSAHPPDICVPNCDSQLRCPPNFFCYRKISGPANPAICIPGLLGFVCDSDVDCLVGRCLSDSDPPLDGSLKLCTASCARDEDCKIYDSQQGRFICSANGHCVTPEAYRGANCNSDADCVRDPGTVCVRPKPAKKTDQGTCLRPCTDGACQPRGGIGHTCLPDVFVADDGGDASACFPGYFPFPCFSNADCAVPELSCPGADLSVAANPQPGLCSIVCTRDEDCQNNRWTAGESYCGSPPLTVCLPFLEDGDQCESAHQCRSGVCEMVMRDNMTLQTCGGV